MGFNSKPTNKCIFSSGSNYLGEYSDNFGRSVALSSDGSIMAIGALKNELGTNTGHVMYIKMSIIL